MDIRWMIRRDMPQVLAIENEAFENPWTESDFVHSLRERNVIGMVATTDDGKNVIGYMLYSLKQKKVDLLNIAVHSAFRRKETGRELIEVLKRKLRQQKRESIEAVVRETNFPAQMWLKSCGFRCVVELLDYYNESEESGYLFKYDLKTPAKMILKNRVSEVSR